MGISWAVYLGELCFPYLVASETSDCCRRSPIYQLDRFVRGNYFYNLAIMRLINLVVSGLLLGGLEVSALPNLRALVLRQDACTTEYVTVTSKVTTTETETETETDTITVTTPGAVVTVTTPGPAVTVTTPGPAVTVTTQGPAVTVTTPGPAVTVTQPGTTVTKNGGLYISVYITITKWSTTCTNPKTVTVTSTKTK